VPKSLAAKNDHLALVFNATGIPGLAEDWGISPLANLHVSLHTDSPGEAGTQATNEIAYGGYGRVAVARTTGGWAVSAGQVTPAADIVFPACVSGGPVTATYAAIGFDPTGAGKVLYYGPVNPAIVVSSGVTPQLDAGSAIILEG
jgi:hypothetical protein